jgi:hypothetical protein
MFLLGICGTAQSVARLGRCAGVKISADGDWHVTNAYVGRKVDEHLPDASREDSRPAPAIGLLRVYFSLVELGVR